MNSVLDINQLLESAIKLLHSSHPNSATELRMIVDEVMVARLGPEKTLTKMLTRKQLENESNFPGRASTPEPDPEPIQMDVDEVINLTHSPPKTISDSPDTIIDSDDGLSNMGGAANTITMIAGGEEDTNLKEFGDLNCCVCKDMMFTATNRLIECSKCGNLYHQECHKPAISDEEASEDQQHNWQCDTCLNKPSTSKISISAIPSSIARSSPGTLMIRAEEPISLISKSKPSSHSSSSSNSSSPFYKQDISTSNSSSKSHHKSSSKSSSKEERSSKGIVTPTINIISADKSSSKKSHSSSKSSKSSKHHDSSSKKKSK